MKKINLVEITLMSGFLLSAVSGLVCMQAKQSYDMVEVRFCPESKTVQGQQYLNRKYCAVPRFLLKETWDNYGSYSNNIKTSNLVFKRELRGDNPHQLLYQGVAVGSFWGLCITLMLRCERLRKLDYVYNELEKNEMYALSRNALSNREIAATDTNLIKERVKDGLKAIDTQERINLTLTDTRNEEIKNQLELEDFLKQRAVVHSSNDKTIAENHLAVSKAMKEKTVLEQAIEELNTVDSTIKDKKKAHGLKLEEVHMWMLNLLKVPFKILTGKQGSGKSTLERTFIRLHKDDGWSVLVLNPETIKKVWSGVEVKTTAEEINETMAQFISDIHARRDDAEEKGIDEDRYLEQLKPEERIAIFVCEANTWEAYGVDMSMFATFIKQATTNIRKWGYTVTLTAHSDNQTSICKELSGFSHLLNNQPRVSCIPKVNEVTFETTSSGKGMLYFEGIKDPNPKEVTLFDYPQTKQF